MPFSNYAPLIDPNAPPNVQSLSGNGQPDFVFQAVNPQSGTQKVGAIFHLAMTLTFLGGIGTYAYITITDNGMTISGLFSEFLKAMETDHDGKIGVLFAIAAIGFSILHPLIKDLIKIFASQKLWYVGSASELSLVQRKNIFHLPWSGFTGEMRVENDSTGDRLNLILKPDAYIPNNLFRKGNPFGRTAGELMILNPPNIMEVKRLMEKRIMPSPSQREGMTMQEFAKQQEIKILEGLSKNDHYEQSMKDLIDNELK